MRNDMKWGHRLAGCQAPDPEAARIRRTLSTIAEGEWPDLATDHDAVDSTIRDMLSVMRFAQQELGRA